ncbi:MAG: hypothetical protein KUG77_14885 [Nannocystaceae bacterium]|nr:hypothetical protein [Nannocystaceae bacterium]
MKTRPIIAGLILLLTACGTTDAPADTDAQDSTGAVVTSPGGTDIDSQGESTDPTAAEETTAADTSGGVTPDTDSAAFFEAIAGLWVAPVTSWTSAGSFPTMNMDVRAASESVLFSRVDLNADNSLRFAFQLEEHDGQSQLVFRNGGEFLGILRDSKAVLEERTGDTWRFCAITAGCGYIDARFAFETPERLRLDVDVMGMRHIEWIATRRETRTLGGAFPSPPPEPNDAPFPPMPQLEVQAQWSVPLEQPADIWLVLTDTDCGLNPIANCVPSRSMLAEAAAGSTSVTLVVEQIHPGHYSANAVLDRNQNLTSGVLLPDAGDAVSFPLDAPTDVPTEGTGTLLLTLNVDI